jgi:hypothetical protein
MKPPGLVLQRYITASGAVLFAILCTTHFFITLHSKTSLIRFNTYRAVNTPSVIQTSQLMLYREIIAVCSQIHTKHINTVCGQNAPFTQVTLFSCSMLFEVSHRFKFVYLQEITETITQRTPYDPEGFPTVPDRPYYTKLSKKIFYTKNLQQLLVKKKYCLDTFTINYYLVLYLTPVVISVLHLTFSTKT